MFLTPMCAVPLGISGGRTVWEQRHNSMIWECEKYLIEIKPKFQHDTCSVPRLPLIYAKWGDRAHHEGGLHDCGSPCAWQAGLTIRKGVFRLVYTFTEAQTRVQTFIDGVAYGDLRTSSNTYTETITVEPGNKIQIWAWSTGGTRQLVLYKVILSCNDEMYLAPGGKLLVG